MKKELEKITFHDYENVENLACYIKDKYDIREHLNNMAYMTIADEAIFRYKILSWELKKVSTGVDAYIYWSDNYRSTHSKNSNNCHPKKWHDLVEYWIKIFAEVRL